VNQYFVLLSGENIQLAFSEIKSLNTLFEYPIQMKQHGKFVYLTCNGNPIKLLLNRAALLKQAGIILSNIDISNSPFKIDSTMIEKHIKPDQSFAIRAVSLLNDRKKKLRHDLITEIGALIKKKTGSKVNLSTPDVIFSIFLLDDETILCKTHDSYLLSGLESRNPGKKPFFHPSMMNAKLSRIMCNLAGVKTEEIVLDPFCGGAGILSEAALLGAKCIGIDLNWTLLKGAHRNLSHIYYHKFSLLQTDARCFPFDEKTLDVIITDPPYGRTSSTRGYDVRFLLHEVFDTMKVGLKTGGRICVSGASEMGISKTIEDVGFEILTKNEIYVHGGLTREIVSAKN
jgi:tRNA (guanine10-N2)-dimethyltransferase